MRDVRAYLTGQVILKGEMNLDTVLMQCQLNVRFYFAFEWFRDRSKEQTVPTIL